MFTKMLSAIIQHVGITNNDIAIKQHEYNLFSLVHLVPLLTLMSAKYLLAAHYISQTTAQSYESLKFVTSLALAKLFPLL